MNRISTVPDLERPDIVDEVVKKWLDEGCPRTNIGIPQECKVHVILETAKEHDLHTFIETGTGFGDLLSRVVDDFDRILSVELHPDFHAQSAERFKAVDHVSLYQGNSEDFVKELVMCDLGPCLWFLDAHYAGEGSARADIDTPVMEELTAIFNDTDRHVVIVDDARLFGIEKDYPTIGEVNALAAKNGYTTRIWGDEIVIT